ncbi:MAG: GNAT family N-acetyltransferase [Actinomycetota bacterium]|nr:GNAT family N-acetyltransferase [Actinomycetota bacterium]
MATSESRGARAPVEFELKVLEAPECDAAVALAIAAYEELCAFKGGDEIARAMWTALMAALRSASSGLEAIRSSAGRSVAFEFKDGPAVIGLGVLTLEPVAREEEAEAFIYLRADQRGRGAGSALLKMLDSWARSQGASGVFFRVPPGSREGKNLGERNGYRARSLKMRRAEST